MRVVVVEDGRTHARVSGVLARGGFAVRVARDGEAGLAACFADPPDVVVSDVLAPGIDGFEVCRRLKANDATRRVPMMLLTSLADPTDVVRALAAGADNILTKPYDDAQLLERVRRLAAGEPRGAAEGDPVVRIPDQAFRITADRVRILDVLVASLEAVTARNAELERSRVAAEAALEETRRAVAARDEVIAVVSHDLRNPLSSLMMSASLAENNLTDTEGLRKKLAVIRRSADRMNRLIDDLLDLTKIDAGHLVLERARHGAGALVEDALAAQRPLADARPLALRADVAPGLPLVYADRERLLQVLANLVGNALKFTPPGGTITVRAEHASGAVRFSVADTGAGIAAEDLPRVFDRFWQARRTAKQGTGLGLPIVRGIVQAHGGEVWAESTPGAGSTFFFTIPLAAQPDVAPARRTQV